MRGGHMVSPRTARAITWIPPVLCLLTLFEYLRPEAYAATDTSLMGGFPAARSTRRWARVLTFWRVAVRGEKQWHRVRLTTFRNAHDHDANTVDGAALMCARFVSCMHRWRRSPHRPPFVCTSTLWYCALVFWLPYYSYLSTPFMGFGVVCSHLAVCWVPTSVQSRPST